MSQLLSVVYAVSGRNLIFNSIFTVQKMDSDLQGQAFDTLFTLASTAVVAQDTRTSNPAIEFLMRAT